MANYRLQYRISFYGKAYITLNDEQFECGLTDVSYVFLKLLNKRTTDRYIDGYTDFSLTKAEYEKTKRYISNSCN